MSDIIIKEKTIKRELVFFLLSLIIAFGMNVYAIIVFDTAWTELVSKLHIVLSLSIIIYLLTLIIRAIILGIIRLIKMAKK